MILSSRARPHRSHSRTHRNPPPDLRVVGRGRVILFSRHPRSSAQWSTPTAGPFPRAAASKRPAWLVEHGLGGVWTGPHDWVAIGRALAPRLAQHRALLSHNFPALEWVVEANREKPMPPSVWYCHEPPSALYDTGDAADAATRLPRLPGGPPGYRWRAENRVARAGPARPPLAGAVAPRIARRASGARPGGGPGRGFGAREQPIHRRPAPFDLRDRGAGHRPVPADLSRFAERLDEKTTDRALGRPVDRRSGRS